MPSIVARLRPLRPTSFIPSWCFVKLFPVRAFGLPLRGDFAGLSLSHIFDQLIGSRYVDEPRGPRQGKRPSFDIEEVYIGLTEADPVLEKDATIIDTISDLYGNRR